MKSDYISLMADDMEIYHFEPLLGWNSETRRFTKEEIIQIAILHLDRIIHRHWDLMIIGDDVEKIMISRDSFIYIDTWRDMLRKGVLPEHLLAQIDDHISILNALKPHWDKEIAIIVAQNFRNKLLKLIPS